jgi:nitrous oxidase accessory protein NosD
MSYTLRGRLESRLAAMLVPLIAAGVISIAASTWWPIELAALMLAVGLVLDVTAYHRLLSYQPGWLALPLAVLELAGVMAVARAIELDFPLRPALALFALSWLWGQAVGHAALPILRPSYAEDGGELARAGPVVAVAASALPVAALGVAWITLPPIVHLEAGVHQGPIVIDRSQRLVGEPGTIVRGGITIRADDVVVRDITVVGGLNGIEIDEAEDVVLDGVRVEGAVLDGIHVRRSTVKIQDCRIESRAGYTQGIDISFAADRGASIVEDCSIGGGQEGIVTHSANAVVRDNSVRGTSLRGITMTEMSMGSIDGNTVHGALGVGIFCGDYSHCGIRDNTVTGTMPDPESDEASRAGYAIQAHFGAVAEIEENRLERNARDEGAFADARIDRK